MQEYLIPIILEYYEIMEDFLVEQIHGKDLTIYGNGNLTRSFCIFDDLIDGLILFMNSSNIGPMNLGNPEELSVLEITKLIRNTSIEKVNLKFLKELEDDPLRRQPEINLAQKELHWEPKIMLKEGLAITREYFEKKLNLEK